MNISSNKSTTMRFALLFLLTTSPVTKTTTAVVSAAWSGLPMPSRRTAALPPSSSVATAGGIGSSVATRSKAPLCMLANNDNDDIKRPLAQEGDWSAYMDENYNRIYYFNHETGESLWEPPTPSFPNVDIIDDEMDRNDEFGRQKLSPEEEEFLGGPPRGGGGQQQQQQPPLFKGQQPRQGGGGNPSMMMENNIGEPPPPVMGSRIPPRGAGVGGPSPRQQQQDPSRISMGGGRKAGGRRLQGPNMMGERGGGGRPDQMMEGRGGGGRFFSPPPPPPPLGYADMRGNPFQMRQPPPPPPQQAMGGPASRVGGIGGPSQSFGGPGGMMGGPSFGGGGRPGVAQSFGGGRPGVAGGRPRVEGGLPPPFEEPPFPFPQRQQQQQQQRGPPQQKQQLQRPKSFYEILQVPRTATRAQIKQSYLNLARQYDVQSSGAGGGGSSGAAATRSIGKRTSKEYNEIARAWMVLSDLALRERYDRQLEMEDQEEEEYRRRMMMMEGGGGMMGVEDEEELERLWMVDDQQEEERRRRGMMMDRRNDDGDNKFRRRGGISIDDENFDNGGNKFQQRQLWNMGARPLDIDEEAEMMMEERERQQAEAAEQDAILQEKARELRKRKFDEDRKREERRRASSERDVVQDKKPMEFGGGQQPPPSQDMNVLMGNMKKKFGEKKMDEAARVQDELTRMSMGRREPPRGGVGGTLGGTAAGSAAPSPKRTPEPVGRRGILFPGKGGIIVEDSPFIAKDILLDKMMGRESSYAKSPPLQERPNQPKQAKFISYMPPEDESDGSPDNFQAPPSRARGPPVPLSGDREREQERLKSIRATGIGKQKQASGPFSPGSPPPMKTSTNTREQQRLKNINPFSRQASQSTTERSTLPGPPQIPTMKTSTNTREQQRLQNMGAVGGRGTGGAQQAVKPPAGREPKPKLSIQQLEEAHRAEMEKLKRQMQEDAEKKLDEEIVNIAKIHAAEINKLRQQLDGRGVRPGPGLDEEIRMLKMAQKSELERMKQDVAQAMENDHAERMKKMEAAHEAEIDQILSDSDGAVSRLRSEIKSLKEAHAAALESMTATHEYEMQQLRADLEARSTELSQSHQAEIEKLTQSGRAASVASTLDFQKKAMDNLAVQHQKEIQTMVTRHEADMEQLRKDLEARSVRETKTKVEEVTKAMAAKHKADMDTIAAQHRQQMESLVQSELNRLHKEHLQELEEARAEKMRLQRKADQATLELKKSDSSMSDSQKLEMVLDSFEGVYDPSVLRKLKEDVKAREEELNRKISQSSQQIYTLQLKLDTNKDAEEKLKTELRTLLQWKQDAEAELKSMRQRAKEKSDEAVRLSKEIESMNREISQLNSQLERLTKERDENRKEISELTQWKKKAEIERAQLEKDLKAKDVTIDDLQYSLNEANIDIAILVPEVARLQDIEKKLNGLVEKSVVDFNQLKEKAEALKAQYEKENKSSADEVQKLKILLSSEQSKNTEFIMKLKDELKAKETEISKIQITSGERSKAIADMEAKLEQARQQSVKAFEENKKKIESMSAAFEKELEKNKAAHQAELDRLRLNLQKDISSLQQDLNARSNVIADLKTQLNSSESSNKKLSGEVIGLQSQRRSTETLLKESSQSLQRSEEEIERLTKQFQTMKQSDVSKDAKIESLRIELNEKSTLLSRLQSQMNSLSSEKEMLLMNLNQLKQWKEKSQAILNELLKELAQKQGTPVDDISEKLTKIKDELGEKDTQLSQAKSAAAALLNKKEIVVLPFVQGEEIGFGVTARPNKRNARELNTTPSLSSATMEQPSSNNGPMSGWAGYKNKQWGGYLDNLSSQTEATTVTTATPVIKNIDYREAEREYLLEAKSLAAVAFQSFEEARKLKGQDQKKYKEALAKANQEKAKVDELLAKAREMKESNEKNSMGP